MGQEERKETLKKIKDLVSKTFNDLEIEVISSCELFIYVQENDFIDFNPPKTFLSITYPFSEKEPFLIRLHNKFYLEKAKELASELEKLGFKTFVQKNY
jgi:hypothetical protein